MPMVPAKCTQCGGQLTVDSEKEAAICEFCGTPFIVEKAINNYTINNSYNVGKIEKAIIYNGPSEENLLKRANEYLQKNDLITACNYFEKVLDLNADNIKAKLGVLSINIKFGEEFYDDLFISLSYDSWGKEKDISLINPLAIKEKREKVIEYYKDYLALDSTNLRMKKKYELFKLHVAYREKNVAGMKKHLKKQIGEIIDENSNDEFVTKFFGTYYIGKTKVNYFVLNEFIKMTYGMNKIQIVNYIVDKYNFDYYQAYYFVMQFKFHNVSEYKEPQTNRLAIPSSFPPVEEKSDILVSLDTIVEKINNVVYDIKEKKIFKIISDIISLIISVILFPFKLIGKVISIIFSPIHSIRKLFGKTRGDKCYICETKITNKGDKILTKDGYGLHKSCLRSLGINFTDEYIKNTNLEEMIYIIAAFRSILNSDKLKKYDSFSNRIESMYSEKC